MFFKPIAIHGTGISTYIWSICMVNLGKDLSLLKLGVAEWRGVNRIPKAYERKADPIPIPIGIHVYLPLLIHH